MSINWTSGDKGIRTLDPLRARQVLSQLSYAPKGINIESKTGAAGLEPTTLGFGDRCSTN